MIVTDYQYKGKGQRNNKWISSKKNSITFTVFINQEVKSNQLGFFPIIAGLAVKKALDSHQVKISLKWPNDLIINNKKIGGILCESKVRGKLSKFIVIGIGINTNETKDDIHKFNIPNTSSLNIECGKTFQREHIISSIIKNLELLLINFPNNIEKIKEAWELGCDHIDASTEFYHNSKLIKGVFKGISIDGSAIIKTRNRLQAITNSSSMILMFMNR